MCAFKIVVSDGKAENGSSSVAADVRNTRTNNKTPSASMGTNDRSMDASPRDSSCKTTTNAKVSSSGM